jgi:hypothetical protein
VMNDWWAFSDTYPDPTTAEDYNEEYEKLKTTTSIESSTIPRERTKFNEDQNAGIAQQSEGLSQSAIIGVSGGAALIVIIGLLILMRIIRRQSVKDAIVLDAKTSVVQESSVLTTTEPEAQSVDYSKISVPSALIEYTPKQISELQVSIPNELRIEASDFKPIVQVSVQNGAPLYTGTMSKDKVLVKIFGSKPSTLNKGVEGCFWEEVKLLHKLQQYEYITRIVGYCTTPVAILIQYYDVGMEQVFTQKMQFRASEVVSIVKDVANAIRVLNDEGIAHRNVKPKNIYLVQRKRAVLGGLYGLVKVESDEKARKMYAVYRIDAKNANYVAPEVFEVMKGVVPLVESLRAYKSVDVFSVAMLLSKLLKSIS